MMVPTVKIKKVWHVGSMDISRKGERGSSYEGNLLSASPCPEAWIEICKLGGNPVFETPSSVTLLDITFDQSISRHKKAFEKKMIEYGLENDLIEYKTLYKATFYDDELDTEFYSLHDTREEAEEEFFEDYPVEEIKEICASDKLKALHSQRGIVKGLDFVMIEWAKDKGYDGVYWREELDPASLSAPRAGLFDHAVKRMILSERVPESREGMKGVGKTKWEEVSLSGSLNLT